MIGRINKHSNIGTLKHTFGEVIVIVNVAGQKQDQLQAAQYIPMQSNQPRYSARLNSENNCKEKWTIVKHSHTLFNHFNCPIDQLLNMSPNGLWHHMAYSSQQIHDSLGIKRF